MKKLFILLPLLILFFAAPVCEATTGLEHSYQWQDYWFSTDGTYLYGYNGDTSVVSRMSSDGTIDGGGYSGFDFADIGANYTISSVMAVPVADCIYVVAVDSTDYAHYLFKSVDGGENFGDNSPAFDDQDPVARLGWDPDGWYDDENQGNLTYVGDGGAGEFRDDGQDFDDWDIAAVPGSATHYVVITNDDATVCLGFLGINNNGGQDIDVYSDSGCTTQDEEGEENK